MRTTIILDDEIYKLLIKKYGKRGISKGIHRIVTSQLFGSKRDLFGSLKEFNIESLEIGEAEEIKLPEAKHTEVEAKKRDEIERRLKELGTK